MSRWAGGAGHGRGAHSPPRVAPLRESRAVVIGVLVALVLTGCGQTAVAPTVADVGLADIGTVAAAQEAAATAPAANDPIPASELRLHLEHLLGHHAVLTAEMLRGTVDGVETVQAAADALSANTLQLRGAMALAYGEVGGAAFANLWVQHVRSFAGYAAGLASGDPELLETALAELADYESDFASFCEVATEQRLPQPAVQELLETHVHDLTDQASAWDEGRLDEAIATTLDAVAHMDGIAAALAGAIADQNPEGFPGVLDGASTTQRSAVARALADLVVLRTQLDRVEGSGDDAQQAAIRTSMATVAETGASAIAELDAPVVTSAEDLTDLLTWLATPTAGVPTTVGELPLFDLVAEHDEAWVAGDHARAYALAGDAVAGVYGLVAQA